VTTDEIDEAVHGMIVARGAYPSPLGYSSFPRSITTSVNNVIARELSTTNPRPSFASLFPSREPLIPDGIPDK
jgi:hypothetical protein